MKDYSVNMDIADSQEESRQEPEKDIYSKEILSSMIDDLLFLVSLVDLQSDYISMAKLHGGTLPESFDGFSDDVRYLADETLVKWAAYILPAV